MSTSKYLTLYTDSKDASAKLTIDASATNVSFNSSTEFRFEKDVSIKSGAATYKNINTAFSTLDTYNTNFYQQYNDDLTVDRNKSLLEISDGKAEVLIVRNDLASELVNARAAELVLRTDLASELVNARAAELVIRNNLATEIVDARAAELVIRNNLATEIVDARAAELVLRTDLAAEVFRSTGTDVANFQTLDGYINVEKLAREARDVLLTNKLNGAGTDLYARMLVLENIIGSLRNEAVYVAVQATYSNV
jgi:hypothetical protein